MFTFLFSIVQFVRGDWTIFIILIQVLKDFESLYSNVE